MRTHEEPIRRVSKAHPCPVCGPEEGTKWCGYTTYMVRCMRRPYVIVGGKAVEGKPHPEGGWVYSARSLEGWQAPPEQVVASHKQVPAAPIEVRDRWYRGLLSLLTLHPTHQANLLGRGLTQAVLWQRHYRSLPVAGRFELCQRLMNRIGGTPVGVPGFYQHPNTGSWLLAGSAGLLIPVLNREGQIQALQVRRDTTGENGLRYTWISSARKGPNGCSSGAPLHVARPAGYAGQSRTVWITEGVLKSERLALWKQELVLAVPGVSARAGVVEELRLAGARSAVVAYDMDQHTKVEVQQALRLLVNEITGAGIQVMLASWDHRYKGVDDALQAGIGIRVSRKVS